MVTDNKIKPYIKAWNGVVQALKGQDKIVCDLYLERFRDAACRQLLRHTHMEACQGVLDCTDEFIRTGKLPKTK